jgi:hypothetical protein
MEPPDLDPGAILAVLLEHEVEFIVIGGLAAAAHGSILPTFDIDIVPKNGADNLTRLSAALRQMSARIRTDAVEGGLPFDPDAESLAAAGVWNLTTEHGDLDLSFVPSGTDGYPDLVREAAEEPFFGVVVRIASLADIIRSKQAANRPKDQRVLPVLREILANRRPDPS